LAGTCRDLYEFFENALVDCLYWLDDQPHKVMGRYSPGVVCLHLVTSLHNASKFIALARQLRVRGGVDFVSSDECASFARVLHLEAHDKTKLHSSGTTLTRLAIPWSFDPSAIRALLETPSLGQVLSEGVCIPCKYGISFTMRLAVSRVSADSPELAFELLPAVMTTECLSPIKISLSGLMVAPGKNGGIVRLRQVQGGTNINFAIMESEEMHDEDDSTVCFRQPGFSRVLSLVRVILPQWLEHD